MDVLKITILEDGTVTVKTSEISDGNHIAAENLLEELESMLGGVVTKKGNPERQRHAHTHNRAFAH